MNLRAASKRPSLTPRLRRETTTPGGQPASGGPEVLEIGPDSVLSLSDVHDVARGRGVRVVLSRRAVSAMENSREALERICSRGEAVYGVTTGFGPFVKYAAECGFTGGRASAAARPRTPLRAADQHGLGLIHHLCAGFGPPAPDEVVRAAMLLRARSVSVGFSAVSPRVLDDYLDLLRFDIVPEVPELGSVGASGDLIPLAFIARTLHGIGRVRYQGRRMSASAALRRARLRPLAPGRRDLLGLVNGTSFMTAYALLAACRARGLVGWAERLTGWAYRLLGCRQAALDPRLHAARGHPEQIRSAAAIRAEALADGYVEDPTRPLQEIYSLRCAPQLLGGCREPIAYASDVIEREINGVNDNPLIIAADGDGDVEAALHGGNFQGQQIAFAADAINRALTQIAVLAERQIDTVLNPQHNGGAPLLLAWEPGPCSGMAGAQITATALVAEMRHHTASLATASIPTNGGNQDVVSMGTHAARHAYQQTSRCAAVLAILGLCLFRLDDLRRRGRAPGRVTPLPAWMPVGRRFTRDVPLHNDIARLTHILLDSSGSRWPAAAGLTA